MSSAQRPGDGKARPPTSVSRRRDARSSRPRRDCPVVGIGASAGGLEAFTLLLQGLPSDSGMAFVLVQHLDPQHASLLSELLSRTSPIPVAEVADGVAVAPDHIYVIPPNSDLVIEKGRLRLSPRTEMAGRHLPIDAFLRSLAGDLGSRTAGVVLSGAGSDGTQGLAAIKSAGGITFAQEPESAKYPAMPRSAIAAGVVDFVLAPDEIARELSRVSCHPYVTVSTVDEPVAPPPGAELDLFGSVFALLRAAFGVDFTDYKLPTIRRRIERRMLLSGEESMKAYVDRLRADAAEVAALFYDILIMVTEFFREPQTFEALRKTILPEIVKGKPHDAPIRVWVPGCATGEEAYSIAISLVEVAEGLRSRSPIKIFATDINPTDLERARRGVYPQSKMSAVTPEHLRRFFTPVDDSYEIDKALREMCVFAKHDVTRDPPFSRIDLISCRNLLIYLEPELQDRTLAMFHYALQPRGILLLGSSETVGARKDLFETLDKRHKVYAKKVGALSASPGFAPTDDAQGRSVVERPEKASRDAPETVSRTPLHEQADAIVVARYAPPGVTVNQNLDIVEFRGDIEPYLGHTTGMANLNVLAMAREGLVSQLKSAIDEAKRSGAPAMCAGVKVAHEDGVLEISVHAIPLQGPSGEPHYLILFAPEAAAKRQGPPNPGEGAQRSPDDSTLAGLRRELDSTRDYLQALIADKDIANEELRAANEEMQSGNEELQSINEELETAKEELQSTNEELITVNEESQGRNLELGRANDDLSNLLTSLSIPVIMLGRDLRIRRFTAGAERILKVIAGDVGRPITDLHLRIDVADLEAVLKGVIETATAFERDVTDEAGRWYSMIVRPYVTSDNRIDGAVVALLDVDQMKRDLARVSEAGALNEALNTLNAVTSSTLEAGELMRRLVVEACRILEAEASFIALRQGGKWVLRYSHGPDERPLGSRIPAGGILARVAASREPVAVAAEGDRGRPALGMPLIRRDECIGALVFTWQAGEIEPGEARVRLVRKLIASITLALDNTLLYAERRKAEQMNAALGIIDSAVNSTRDLESVVRVGLTHAVRAMQCDGAAVVFRDGDSWTVREVVGLAQDLVGRSFMTKDLPGASVALRKRQPMCVADAARDARIAPGVLREFSVGAFVIAPLVARRQVVGAMVFTYRRPLANDYAELQTEFAAKLARSVSLALENARLYDAEHRTAEVLRNLLLQPVPTIDGINIGTAFETALAVERVGGDFFDIFELDDHRCAFFIADVLGKGLQAAGLTEMIRSSVRALMELDPSPGVVLSRVNNVLLRRLGDDRFATALLMVVDTRSGEVTCARAGHPLPILCGRDCAMIEMPTGLPLGAFSLSFSEQRMTLRPGESVVLYTDGVTEARRRKGFFGDSRLLATLASQESREPQVLADALLHAVRRFGTRVAHDDIAIVAFALDGSQPAQGRH